MSATTYPVAPLGKPRISGASEAAAARLQATLAPGHVPSRREWNALLHSSGANSMFLNWEWQDVWWRHMGRGNAWHVTLKTEAETLGVVPLYRDSVSWCGVPLRRLRLIGDGTFDGDDLDAIVTRGHERAAAMAMLRLLLARRDWSLLQLHPVPDNSAFLAALCTAARRLGLTTRTETYGCTHTPLPGTWDAYLADLPSRLRSRVRSLLRRVVDAEGFELRRVQTAADLDAGLDVLFDLHQRRWQAAGEPGSFADDTRRALYGDFAFRALQHGWLRLYTLWQGSEPIAAQIGYVYGGVFLQIQEGFAPEAAEISPGVALRAAVLRDCIAEGLNAYDNLLGTPPQKMRWGGTVRHVHRFTLARPGSLGAAVLRARNRWSPPPQPADSAGTEDD